MPAHFVELFREMRDPGNYTFSLYAAPPLFTSSAILALGLFVLIQEKHSTVKGSFFLLTFTISLWLSAFGLMFLAANEVTAYRWAKLAYIAVPSVPAAGYFFAATILRNHRQQKRKIFLFFTASLAFSAILVGTPWFFDGVRQYAWGYYPQYTLWSLFYLAYFFGVTGLCIRNFFLEYRSASLPVHRARMRLLLIGSAIACLAILDYLPKFGVPLYPFGYAGILVFTVLTAFVVTIYRLVDITPSFAAERIIGTMGDGLLVLDVEDIIRVANDKIAELFDVRREDLVGTPLSSLSESFPLKTSAEHVHRVGADHAYEMAHERADGRVLLLSVSESGMKDEKGCVIATVLMVKDLTQLKLTETALQETENRLTKLTRETPEAIIILDEYGRFSSVNPAAEKLLGLSGEKLEGKIFVMSRFLPSQCISKVLKVMRAVIQGQAEDPFELELMKEDGSSVKVQAVPSPVRHHGKICEVQFILHAAFAEDAAVAQALEKERAEMERRMRRKLEEIFKDDKYLMQKIEKLKF